MGMMQEGGAQRSNVIPEAGIDASYVESEDGVSFSEESSCCCVGIIDIVNCTRTTASLSREKMSKYYSLFMNSVAPVVKKYAGVIVKNGGDSLLYYFPHTDGPSSHEMLRRCLDCSLALAREHPKINTKFNAELLPELNYRISLDYGEVTFARAFGSSKDIFGPTVNICAKINRMASPNTVVVGGDLYQVSKDLAGYRFQDTGKSLSIGNRPYPVYSLSQVVAPRSPRFAIFGRF